MSDYGESFFIVREYMTSVYETGDISDFSQMASDHFVYHEDEVLYWLDEGRLLGVPSVGNLERFLTGKGTELA